ncbi:hypothetical protein ZEAMMB73_Zm00001d035584 [Zea mays]|uniref:Uncharacterized protein n=1 Tax=Zea mays TaxID=4577 RepID=A0A1D6LHG6_MAIZE|nr:hypothetical protein ZEAMMB73_Zm00001d035584 [Zea mays]
MGTPAPRSATPGRGTLLSLGTWSGQDPAEVSADERRQPEVRDLGREGCVEEDVLRLDVAVDDALAAALVQVAQSSCDPDGDPVPLAPIQRSGDGGGAALLEQMRVEGAVHHVLVHKQPLVAFAAEADQSDQVPR